MEHNLFAQFLAAGRRGPAVTDETGRTVTWDDIDTLAGRLGAAFARWGLAKGDRLAVCADKSLDAYILFLAALRSGLGYMPINTALSAREIEVVLEAARPAAVVFAADKPHAGETGRRLQVPRLVAWESGKLDELLGEPGAAPVPIAPTEPDDLAVLIFTSGTTGRPKGAMLSHANLLANARDLGRVWKLGHDDVVLHALPIFHGHGLIVAGIAPIVAGAGLLMLPRFDIDAVVDHLAAATVMMGVPTFYTRLVASPRFAPADVSRIRLFTCGSAPMPGELLDRFQAMTGQRIVERYGTTECNIATSERIGETGPPGYVGAALPSVDLRISDGAGRALPEGAAGSVEVRGPSVFLGYLDDPDATRRAYTDDGWFITGDLGVLEQGRLRLVGRIKDLIISGGYNVYAKEVENVLDALPGVAESAVIGVPHPDFGEAVVAVVVPEADAGDRTALAAFARREARDQLSNYKAPKSVQVVDEMPRNAMGKVLKTALRDTYKNLFARSAAPPDA